MLFFVWNVFPNNTTLRKDAVAIFADTWIMNFTFGLKENFSSNFPSENRTKITYLLKLCKLRIFFI